MITICTGGLVINYSTESEQERWWSSILVKVNASVTDFVVSVTPAFQKRDTALMFMILPFVCNNIVCMKIYRDISYDLQPNFHLFQVTEVHRASSV